MSIAVLGRGEAAKCKRADFDAAARPGSGDRTVAEAALAAIRYADPAAFTMATAVARAVAAKRDDVMPVRDRVGIISISPDGPVEAMAAMNQAAREGSSSPIRFPASNAGSLAGLPSIGFTLRGPTLMLTMPPERGVPTGLLVARAFLERGVADYMFLATCVVPPTGAVARCLLLGRAGDPVGDADVAWLASPTMGGSPAAPAPSTSAP